MSLRLLSKPPRIKVLEAAGCIGDGRVRLIDENRAVITSSRGEKEYKVVVVPEKDGSIRAYSNDNGTALRGYVGYPILAVMMLKGILPIDNEVVKAMAGVPWKDLNERYGKYSVVENIVLDRAERMGFNKNAIVDYMNIVMKKLSVLKVYYDESLKQA